MATGGSQRRKKSRRRGLTVPVDQVPDRTGEEVAPPGPKADEAARARRRERDRTIRTAAFVEGEPDGDEEGRNEGGRMAPVGLDLTAAELAEEGPEDEQGFEELDELEEVDELEELEHGEAEEPPRRAMARTVEMRLPPQFQEEPSTGADEPATESVREREQGEDGEEPAASGALDAEGHSIDISLEDLEVVGGEEAGQRETRPSTSGTAAPPPPPPPTEGAGRGPTDAVASSGEPGAPADAAAAQPTEPGLDGRPRQGRVAGFKVPPPPPRPSVAEEDDSAEPEEDDEEEGPDPDGALEAAEDREGFGGDGGERARGVEQDLGQPAGEPSDGGTLTDVEPIRTEEEAAAPSDEGEPSEALDEGVPIEEAPSPRDLEPSPSGDEERATAAASRGLDPGAVVVGVIQVIGVASPARRSTRGSEPPEDAAVASVEPGPEGPGPVGPPAPPGRPEPITAEQEVGDEVEVPTELADRLKELADTAEAEPTVAVAADEGHDADHEELDPSEIEEIRDSSPEIPLPRETEPDEVAGKLEAAAAAAASDEGEPRPSKKESVPPPPPQQQDLRPSRPAGSPAPVAPPPPPLPAVAEDASGLPRRKRRTRKAWWEEIFDDDYLRSQPTYSDRQTQKEVDFFQAAMGVEPGGMLLDLGCGSGRHAVEFSKRGYQVVGLDLSLAMLARAAELAQRAGQKINFIHGDMREMAFEATFDGVYCVGTSFGYFDEETNARVLTGIHRALKRRGVLVLEVVNRDYLINQQPSMVWFEGDGCVCMEESSFNFITSRLRVKRSLLFEAGRQVEHEFSFRAYCLHEIGQFLHAGGFRVAEVSGHIDTPGAFFGPDSQLLVILAEKRG